VKYLVSVLFCLILCSCNVFGELRADINNDGRVDLLDFAILSKEWLMSDYSLKFNGINQHVEVANNAVFDFGTGDFSISFWVKGPITTGDLLERETLWNLAISSTYVNFLSLGDLCVGTFAFDNNWHHVVMTFDRGVANTCYVDTNNVTSGNVPSSTNYSSADKLTIGKGLTTGYAGAIVDDIRFYKGKVLSLTEIAEIYNSGTGVKLDGTEQGLSWGSNCDDGTGNVLTDVKGTVNGALSGNVGGNMWEIGGVPFAPSSENMSTFNVGGIPISVSYATTGADFTSPTILNTAYVSSDLIIDNPSDFSDSLNLEGVPLSVSLCQNPNVLPSSSPIGYRSEKYFYVLDVIEITDTDVDQILEKGPNKLQVDRIDFAYYLDTIIFGASPTVSDFFMFKGLTLGVGQSNELILNKTSYTIDDVDTLDPSANVLDTKELMWDGIPLLSGRIGNNYYLMVHPVAIPT
jgi:hypothetical protein